MSYKCISELIISIRCITTALLLHTKLFKVNSLPIRMFFVYVIPNRTIGKNFIAWRTPVLNRRHVSLLHMSPQIINAENCLSTQQTDEAVLALLHLSLQQQLQLLTVATDVEKI
jgi:hypothetical protein